MFAKPSLFLKSWFPPMTNHAHSTVIINWYESIIRSFPMAKTPAGPPYAPSCQGFSQFERRRVKSERAYSQRASLKRSLSFFMHPPRHLAETLVRQGRNYILAQMHHITSLKLHHYHIPLIYLRAQLHTRFTPFLQRLF